MSALGNNSEVIVFGVSVVPIMVLVFRFLLKLQLSCEDIYERRQHTQSATIEEQEKLIAALKLLQKECLQRDEAAQLRIDGLVKELVKLRKLVEKLQVK